MFLEKLPLFALAALAAGLTVAAQTTALQSLQFIALENRVANAIVSYVAYLGQTIYPINLAVDYAHPVGNWEGQQVAGALVILAAFTGLAFWQARLRPYLLVGWLWYLGMLVPVIGLIQVGEQSRADRYMYLPHIGLFVAVVWGVADILRSRRWFPVAMAGAAVGILAAPPSSPECSLPSGATAGHFGSTPSPSPRTTTPPRPTWRTSIWRRETRR